MSVIARIWVQSPIVKEWRELIGYTPLKWSDSPGTYCIGTHDGLLHVHDKDGTKMTFSLFYIEERL